ncbi:MAG: hypothetical protein COV75_03835 [Candidatus Omnitrophica bacterium CG11_big_fil_rev_8_21_14_0_20_63_9]|nr:MAG: hypothetical protein COV75_03835 [Candidatus Omnitrophica bacterium CG11_big_fil_rev_8_21_14_0_20_63_9]
MLVTSMVGWVGTASAEREGSGSHHSAAPIQEGESVELTGRITGSSLTVTEGPYAGQRFALVENHALEELEDAGLATATYRVSGKALEYRGTNRILISSFQRASASAPAAQYREGTGTSPQRSYREGS